MATVSFNYTSSDNRTASSDPIYQGLTTVDQNTTTGGLLYGLGDNRRALGMLANVTGKWKNFRKQVIMKWVIN